MRSVNFMKHCSCSPLGKTTQVWFLQLYFSNLIGEGLMVQSSLQHGFSQESVLDPLLFNIFYKCDMPSTISRKFAYADNLALLYSFGNWKDLEGTLIQDMITLLAYLYTWRLILVTLRRDGMPFI